MKIWKKAVLISCIMIFSILFMWLLGCRNVLVSEKSELEDQLMTIISEKSSENIKKYNNKVENFNEDIKKFPNNLIGSLLGYTELEYIEEA